MSELTELQRTTRASAIAAGCDPDILDAGGHALSCKCPKCFKYWKSMKPADPRSNSVSEHNLYSDLMEDWSMLCPFTEKEIGEGIDVWIESVE